MSARLLALLLLALAVPTAAFAQDDEEDEAVDDGDSQATYDAFKAKVAGQDPLEEIDAWWGYLDQYPDSPYRLQIEGRIEALEEQSFDAAMAEELEQVEEKQVDAKEAEIDVFEPALLHMSPNTRRRVKVTALWGVNDLINYDANFEWAFLRQLSVHGGFRHRGTGGSGVGLGLYGGAKGAIVKDVRTGIVMSGALNIAFTFNSLDRGKFELEPWWGIAWVASSKFQLQTNLSMELRLGGGVRHQVLWDVMAVVSPGKIVSIYFESRQKHSLRPIAGLGTKYLAFFHAGAGAKIRPTDKLELTVGVNVPYFWSTWKDYRYAGIHAGANFYFGKGPKN
jgi:hypothetical protein